MSLSADIRALVIRHIATLCTEASAVDHATATLREARFRAPGRPADPGAASTREDGLAALAERVHKIKGSSGSLGFRQVSEAARLLEMDLRQIQTAPTLSATDTARLQDKSRALCRLVAELGPEDSTLYNRDLDHIRARGAGTAGG